MGVYESMCMCGSVCEYVVYVSMCICVSESTAVYVRESTAAYVCVGVVERVL